MPVLTPISWDEKNFVFVVKLIVTPELCNFNKYLSAGAISGILDEVTSWAVQLA